MNATGELRVSDADRDTAVTELSEHFQAGRLTAEELDERTGRALRARTGRELAELLADLPGPVPTPDRDGGTLVRGRPLLRPLLMVLMLVVAVNAAAGATGHVRVDLFPWWLAVAGYFVWRRCARR